MTTTSPFKQEIFNCFSPLRIYRSESHHSGIDPVFDDTSLHLGGSACARLFCPIMDQSKCLTGSPVCLHRNTTQRAFTNSTINQYPNRLFSLQYLPVVIMPITPPAGSGSAISTPSVISYTTTSVATNHLVNPSEALQKLVDKENPVP